MSATTPPPHPDDKGATDGVDPAGNMTAPTERIAASPDLGPVPSVEVELPADGTDPLSLLGRAASGLARLCRQAIPTRHAKKPRDRRSDD
jgi:hypothetical protein